MVTITDLEVYPANAAFIEQHFDALTGGKVLAVPQLGHDIVVFMKGTNVPYNLGQVTAVAHEDGSGRNFLIRTQNWPMVQVANGIESHKDLYIQLAQGIRAKNGLDY